MASEGTAYFEGEVYRVLPYQYTGREADTPGLYYYRARYYSPKLPGFISEDSITFGGGQLSFYAYVGADPLSYTDPLGLFLWPWESPVTIYGGTPEQQAQVQAAVNQVFSTPRGQEMLSQIEGPWYEHGNPQDIYINDNGQNDTPSLGSGEVYVDPNSHPIIPTTNGRIPASLSRIIAHEFGHSLMGDDDDGPCRMNNVNKNENPVAGALGQPLRTAY